MPRPVGRGIPVSFSIPREPATTPKQRKHQDPIQQLVERINMSIYNVDTMTNKDIRIRASVGKWGNSAAVRLPATLLAQANFADKQAVDLVLKDGRIILEPVTAKELNLKDMLARITPENIHGEVDFGEPAGRELI
jgi:antitoxin MazE